MSISQGLRKGWRQGGQSLPRSSGPGPGANTHGAYSLCCVGRCACLGGLGTELSLSEYRKQLSQGGWSTWAGSLARCLGMRLGVVGSGGPGEGAEEVRRRPGGAERAAGH